MRRNLAVTALVAVIIAGFVLGARYLFGAVVPPVDGFTEGQRIRFIHTEASDPLVAELLTKMKGSPVIVVPELAKVSNELLANVYVFKNGVPGNGPFGFQADVFDYPPGTVGYRPLRTVNLVTWKSQAASRQLRSADEIRRSIDAGELALEQPGVVVNMPLLTWPGGNR